jgi:hypothetical protein
MVGLRERDFQWMDGLVQERHNNARFLRMGDWVDGIGGRELQIGREIPRRRGSDEMHWHLTSS